MRRFGLAMLLIATAVTVPAIGQAACMAPLGRKISSVRVPGHPFEPVFSVDGCTVFVSLTPEGAIAVLQRDGHNYVVRHVVPVGGRPTAMVLTHDGRTLIATDTGGGQVLLMDAAALAAGSGQAVRARVGNGQMRGAVYANVTGDDHYLLVSDERGAAVTVVDLHTDQIVGAIPTGRAPIALTFSPDGRWLFMTSEVAAPAWNWPRLCGSQAGNGRGPRVAPQGAVLVADLRMVARDPAHAVVNTVPAGCSPVRLALSPDGATAYVTARTDDAVLAFSTAALIAKGAHPELGSVRVGTAPVGIAVSPDGRWIIATNSNRFGGRGGGGSLALVPAAAFGQQAAPRRRTLAAGGFPRELRLSPGGATLAVTNFSSGAVEFIDLTRALPRH